MRPCSYLSIQYFLFRISSLGLPSKRNTVPIILSKYTTAVLLALPSLPSSDTNHRTRSIIPPTPTACSTSCLTVPSLLNGAVAPAMWPTVDAQTSLSSSDLANIPNLTNLTNPSPPQSVQAPPTSSLLLHDSRLAEMRFTGIAAGIVALRCATSTGLAYPDQMGNSMAMDGNSQTHLMGLSGHLAADMFQMSGRLDTQAKEIQKLRAETEAMHAQLMSAKFQAHEEAITTLWC